MDIKSIFTSYLLLPLIVIVTAAIMTVVNKKNQFLNNKRLIVSILLIGLILAVPGFLGCLGLDFMPWGYVICQIYYAFFGIFYVYLLSKHYPQELLERKGFITIATLIAIMLSVFLYQLAFNWLSNIDYGLWASTSMAIFLIPLFFWWAYVSLLNIPTEIYKIWQYPMQPLKIDMDHLDFDRLLVLELELYKHTEDPEPLRVKVKAPQNMNFGLWFHKFIDDYNLKFPKSTVQYLAEDQEAYKWIFYIKTSFFKRNIFIDPDLDITQNKIEEKFTIYAKRVSETINRPEKIDDDTVFM